MKITHTENWHRQILIVGLTLFAPLCMFIGIYFHIDLLLMFLIGASSFFILMASSFLTIGKKDIKDGYNPTQSHIAGWLTIISLVIFWIIGLSSLYGDNFHNPALGSFIVNFIFIPTAIVCFFGAPLLFICFAIKSFIENKTFLKVYGYRTVVDKKSGPIARIVALGYLYIGIIFLLFVLSITYGITCSFKCMDNNIFWKAFEVMLKPLTIFSRSK